MFEFRLGFGLGLGLGLGSGNTGKNYDIEYTVILSSSAVLSVSLMASHRYPLLYAYERYL